MEIKLGYNLATHKPYIQAKTEGLEAEDMLLLQFIKESKQKGLKMYIDYFDDNKDFRGNVYINITEVK